MTNNKDKRDQLARARASKKSANPESNGLPLSREDLVKLSEANAVSPEQTMAQQLADRLVDEQRVEKDRVLNARDEGKVFYVQCRYCPSPGIFFQKNPGTEPFGPQDWYSSYKALNAGWIQMALPWCQKCNKELPLRKQADGAHFMVVKRFLRYTQADDHQLSFGSKGVTA